MMMMERWMVFAITREVYENMIHRHSQTKQTAEGKQRERVLLVVGLCLTEPSREMLSTLRATN